MRFFDVENSLDYYSFGMLMPERNGGANYRYGYGSQERDDEVSGKGNSYTATYWQYDSRLGRRWNIDPVTYPWQSAYSTNNNNPIIFTDPTGLYGENKAKRKRKKAVKRYGEDRVTDIYYNEDKDDWGFGVVNNSKGDKYTRPLEGEIGVWAYKTTGIYNNKDFHAFDAKQLGSGVRSPLHFNDDLENYVRTGMMITNSFIGALSTYTVYKGGYHKWNEIWHQTKTKGTAYRWQKTRWNNPGAKYHRANQIAKVQNARNLSSKLTKIGGGLIVADIALSGELKPSHAINAAMIGISTTGLGAVVAGVWFIADFGTMGINYLIYGEAKSIGDMIDESTGTIKMYNGIY